jgi:hypothetical protein
MSTTSGDRLTELEASGLEARSAELLVVLTWLVSGELGIEEADLNAEGPRVTFLFSA